MNQKKPILRMDLLSRKSYPAEQLYRLVKQGDRLVLDKDGSLKGRGIYVKKDSQTIEILFKKGILKRFTKDMASLAVLEKELKNAD